MYRLSSKVISSSLFFFMAIFVFLSLIVSNISETFSQLFLVFSLPFRAHDFISSLLLLFWMCMCIGFVIISIKKRLNNKIECMVAGGIGFVVGCILSIRFIIQTLNDFNVIVYSAYDLSEMIIDNIILIALFSSIYIFFIFIPLLLGALKIHLNIFDKLGKRLESFKPSLNISLFMLFAYAIQPYYDKHNALLYLDLWMFYVGLGLVIVVLYRNKSKFGFYEYANLLWLFVGIIIFIFSSHTISQTNYNLVRLLFVVIGLIGWCGDWMLLSLQESKKRDKSIFVGD